MQNEIEIRRSKLLTARMSDDDLKTLDDLSEHTDRTRSDTIIRAFKFWLNVADASSIGEVDEEKWGKIRKNNRIHARITDSDMELLNEYSEKTGLSVGQILRRSVREYHKSLKNRY